MNDKFKDYFSIILILAALIGAGVFVFKDFKKTSAPKETINNQTDAAPLEVTENSKAEIKNSAPNLNRQIVMKIELPPGEAGKIINEIQDLSLTLKQTPDYLAGWLQLGILRKFIGDYDGAVEAWKYASVIRPKEPISYNNLGDIYGNYLHDPKQAEIYMKKAVELEPGAASVYRNLHDLYYFSFKDKDKGMGVLLKGLEKLPTDTGLMVILAGDYLDKGDKINAKKYYDQALALDPPNKDAIIREMQGGGL